MESIDILKSEHEVIQRALALLEGAVRRWRAGEEVPGPFAGWIVEFFRHFADHCHHAKEEDAFFPRLVARGIPREGGPVGVMLHEHELGRYCIRQMDEAACKPTLAVAQFVAAAQEYLPLLRQHIDKENHILFHMAERVLTIDDDRELVGAFKRMEEAAEREGVHERLTEELAKWEATLAT